MSKFKKLSSFTVAMISVSAILNLRGLPVMASEGMHAIFFYLAGALCFLLPSALVCAELASHYPQDGGIYDWVKRAFGLRVGFVAIWMEWINNVIAFPATLSTILMTIALVFFPNLSQHPLGIFAGILFILWSITFFNFLGIKITSKLNVLGALFGTILPGALILILGIWHWKSQAFAISPWMHQPILPDFKQDSLAILVSVFGAFSGMQITAFYAKDIEHPKRTFPRAIFAATVIILILSIAGVWAIDLVVPPSQVNIVAGVMQSFQTFFNSVNLPLFSPLLALLIALGMIASLSAWISGPARGFRIALENMQAPRVIIKKNRFNTPVALLIMQAIVASLLTCLFLLSHSTQQAFWILIALTSQFTVLMYILVFSSALKLRISRIHKKSSKGFVIPGNKIGIFSVCSIGILACFLAFLLGLNPPASMHWAHPVQYVGLMMFIDLLIILFPFIILRVFQNGFKAG